MLFRPLVQISSMFFGSFDKLTIQFVNLPIMIKKLSDISAKIEDYRLNGKRIFTTSSFQTHSIVLLHIISRIDRSIPVYFLNTGYLFPKTIAYKNQIAEEFGLTVLDLKSATPKVQQKDVHGDLLFASDPDYCCHINKVVPLDDLLPQFDVWINGVRADQTAVRAAMSEEQDAPHNVVRYHPMLSWTKQDIYSYIKEFNLPRHPLDELGYSSIGCEPCTHKPNLNDLERSERWSGLMKTECGINTDLIINPNKLV